MYVLGMDLGISWQPAPYLLQALNLLSKFLVYPAKKRMSATDVGLFLVKSDRMYICVCVCVCVRVYVYHPPFPSAGSPAPILLHPSPPRPPLGAPSPSHPEGSQPQTHA